MSLEPRPNTIEHHVRPELGLEYRLDEEARRSVIRAVNDYGLAEHAARQLATTLAIGSLDGIPTHMTRQFGPTAAELAQRTAECVAKPFWDGISMSPPPRWYLWLLKAPDWYLLRFIEQSAKGSVVAAAYGEQLIGRSTAGVIDPLFATVSTVLAAAGGSYELVQGADGWHVRLAGEDLLQREVLQPALRVLSDPRLAGTRADLESSLQGLAAGTLEGNERAIQEAAAAVEGALAVLMGQHRLTSKDSVHARWVTLQRAGILAPHFEQLVTAASVIRNKEAGHSRQTTPRSAITDSARAAVYSACVAIGYLGSHLS